MRAGSFGWQLLELAGWSGLQECFGGAFATSNARLDLAVSRDEASGALMMGASSLALLTAKLRG